MTSTLQAGRVRLGDVRLARPDRDRLRGPPGPAPAGDGPDARSTRSPSSALPPRIPGSASVFNDFAGGGYFYLDHRDRAVIPTTTRHVYVVAIGDPPAPRLERDYDLTGAVPLGDKIISALPDWSGRIWFASTNGVVGYVDPATGAVRSQRPARRSRTRSRWTRTAASTS